MFPLEDEEQKESQPHFCLSVCLSICLRAFFFLFFFAN
jgi:hypothetical protein